MIKCIIIEDQPPAQRVLQKYIRDMEGLVLKATFSDAIQAVEYLRTEPIDLIFLDIHLPKISGLDFLKALVQRPHVVLTTAFPDYALESYDHDVVDYLLKPFSFQRFVKAVSKVPEQYFASKESENVPLGTGEANVLFVKSGYEHIKINISDILFIKSEADYTEIFTPNKKYLTSQSLKYWLEKLGDSQFIQIHKSYIINPAKIAKISGNRVIFDKEHLVPLGRAYKDDFVAKFLKP